MSDKTDPKLHEVPPRETSGRDTISRYQAQFRAAALEALKILDSEIIDRVYCDYHDDFVVRDPSSGEAHYHFFQVKTKSKRNHQWSLLDLFGVYKNKKEQNKDKIIDSFIGKLLLHTINFKDSCGNVVFLTNIHFKNEVEDMIEDLEARDYENKHTKILINNFNDCYGSDGNSFGDEKIKKLLSKLVLAPGVQYLNEKNDFEAIARDQIYKYSEIDLEYVEAKEIIDNLISLAEKKSFGKLIKPW